MSVGGVCAICEEAPAVASCTRCGTVVCERHVDRSRGLCVECASLVDDE